MNKDTRVHLRKYMIDKQPTQPTQKQCIILIQKLTQQCQTLSHRISALERQQNKVKRKIDPVTWLQEKYPDNPTLTDFLQRTCIPDSFIDQIHDSNLFCVMQTFLQEALHQDKTMSPFFSFSQHPNDIYIHVVSQWKQMDKKELIYMMNTLQKQALQQLHAWKKRKQTIIE